MIHEILARIWMKNNLRNMMNSEKGNLPKHVTYSCKRKAEAPIKKEDYVFARKGFVSVNFAWFIGVFCSMLRLRIIYSKLVCLK